MKALLVLLALCGTAFAQKANHKWVYDTEGPMGTKITVFVWTDDEAKAVRANKLVLDEIKRLDLLMTTWHRDGVPDGEVIQINNAAGDHPVVVGDETYAVIARAMDVSKRSGGVFDITVGGFKGLWKFDEDNDQTIPDMAEVKKRLAVIGWQNIEMDPAKKTVFLKKKGMAITLGGIAKGYAVDKASQKLKDAGYKSFIVQAGGDMYVAGDKDGDPWTVAIRDPRGPEGSYFAGAPIKDHSFSTSGDYERFVIKNGVRYHHILDPKTGMPATASRSVTIRATDAFTADAWSKVMFIDGPALGMEVIKKEGLQDFEAVWVDKDNKVKMTSGIQQVLRILKEPSAGI
jgi:thiamine biosynthesis lipoprotein|nr:FAD:protein FMN transferase [Kofleriaceae bacterium]